MESGEQTGVDSTQTPNHPQPPSSPPNAPCPSSSNQNQSSPVLIPTSSTLNTPCPTHPGFGDGDPDPKCSSPSSSLILSKKLRLERDGGDAETQPSAPLAQMDEKRCSSSVGTSRSSVPDATRLVKSFPRNQETSNSSQNLSWQETKTTIKARTSCLLNSERLSDVQFIVGSNETPIYGHKTILSAGSPYFEKLFFGPMAEIDNLIRIPDIEPEVFLSFLKYLYTDEFDREMTDFDTMHLLQPAKMYIVPHLADKCTELLIERISPENVLIIYNRALVFDEPKLATLCLRFLDRQIDKVIETDSFLDIDLGTLITLLGRENLRVDECTLYKGVLRWADMECNRNNMPNNPSNKRAVLGDAIFMIRFPTMQQEEFCVECVTTGLLSEAEIIGVFMNLCIGNDMKALRPETPFPTERRVFKPKLHYLNRFSDVLSKVLSISLNPSYPTHSDVLYSSKLRFRCDQRIFLHGLGVYGISSPVPNTKFNATASVSNCQGIVLSLKGLDGSGRSYDFRMPFQVMFDRPIEITPEAEYVLTAVLKLVRESFTCSVSGIFGPSVFSTGSYGTNISIDSYYGSKGQARMRTNCPDGVQVNFTFITPTNYHVAESFVLGQIPQLIFSV